MTGFTIHTQKTPVDAAFKKFAWEKPAATAAA